MKYQKRIAVMTLCKIGLSIDVVSSVTDYANECLIDFPQISVFGNRKYQFIKKHLTAVGNVYSS